SRSGRAAEPRARRPRPPYGGRRRRRRGRRRAQRAGGRAARGCGLSGLPPLRPDPRGPRALRRRGPARARPRPLPARTRGELPIVVLLTYTPGVWIGVAAWWQEWLWHVAGCIAADWLAGGPHVSPGASLAALALGMADYPEFLCRFGGQVAGALLAWPFCGIIGAPLGLKPLGGPSFDPALLPLEQAALYEASAAFLLNLAVLSLNHAERLVPLRRFYLLKAGLTAAVIRVMLQGRGDRGRRPTLWSTTPATGAPPSAAPSQRPACSRTAPGAPSSGPRLGPRALPARSGSPSSSDPRGGAAAVARRVGAAATPARPLSDIRSVGSLVLRFPPGQRLGRIRCGVAAQAALPRRTPQTLRS
ncbi:unnamed protein product, partial [Prorocentrum cordatum]